MTTTTWTVDDAFETIRRANACFVPNIGNAGDGLIALGTFQAFRAAGLSLPVIPLSRSAETEAFDLIVYGGGGQLVPPYADGLMFLQHCARIGKPVIVLPHTVAGYGAELRAISGTLRILCRELVSYEGLIRDGFPRERLGLGHDMALSISPGFFTNSARQPGIGTSYCFRTDAESACFGTLPPGNRDIALSWNGDLWHDKFFTESVCRTLAEYLLQFETVETDRLHITILSAMLGRRTRTWANSYYKNRAVYEFSLRERFPNIDFQDIASGDS